MIKSHRASTKYTTSDGKEFDSLDLALDHQNSIQIIASTDPAKVKAPMYQVELMVVFPRKEWEDGYYVYVSTTIVDEEIVKKVAIATLEKELREATDDYNYDFLFAEVYNFNCNELYDNNGEEWDDDFEHFKICLTGSDLNDKVAALKVLTETPFQDGKIIPYLTDLLQDNTPCVVSIPYMYGEIRWLAFMALVKELKATGIKDTTDLSGVVIPLSLEGLMYIAKQYNIEVSMGGHEGVFQIFSTLQELKVLPTF